MQTRTFSWFILTGVLLISFGTVSCSADIQKPNEKRNKNPDVTEPDQETKPDQIPKLKCVNPCTEDQYPKAISFHPDDAQKQIDIEVQYSLDDGTPLNDETITFKLNDQNQVGMTLSHREVRTNENGLASVTLDAMGASPGSVKVIASAPRESVDPLKWRSKMKKRTKAPYKVNVDYSGVQTLGSVKVSLYPEQNFSCEVYDEKIQTLREGLSYSYPMSPSRQKTKTVASNEFPTQVVFDDIENGNAYAVVVHGKSNSHAPATVASGCKDENPSIQDAEPVELDLNMLDHLPRADAQYKLNHTFDLRGGLPESVQTLVSLLARITKDTGSFVLGCPEQPAADTICSEMPGAKGLTDILLDILPEDSGFRKAMEIVLDIDTLNTIFRNKINQMAQNWLDNNAPQWVHKADEIKDDMRESLKRFEVEGDLKISKLEVNRADSKATIPENKGTQEWNTFYVKWTGQCPTDNSQNAQDCRQRSFGPGVIGTEADAITGKFGGEITETRYLKINEHSLDISYGAIALSIAEQVILPSIFGNNCGSNNQSKCNTMEKALRTMIDCERISNQITNVPAAADSLETTCNQLVDGGANRVRDFIANQLKVGDRQITLESDPQKSCQLFHPDAYPESWAGEPLPYTQFIGLDKPAEQTCHWNVDFNIPDYQKRVKGTFYGNRSGEIQQNTSE